MEKLENIFLKNGKMENFGILGEKVCLENGKMENFGNLEKQVFLTCILKSKLFLFLTYEGFLN